MALIRKQHETQMELAEVQKDFYQTHTRLMLSYQKLIDLKLGNESLQISDALQPYLKELHKFQKLP